MPTITVNKVDAISVPSQDVDRALDFYVNTLGMRRDENAKYDVWAGATCFGIWDPTTMGGSFEPNNASALLNVDDVAAARTALEAEGVTFETDTFDTGVCHMAIFTDPDGNRLALHHRYKAD